MIHEPIQKSSYNWRNRALLALGHVLVGIFFAGVLALAFGWIIAFLWNHILPDLLGTRPITYWQSVGLLIMARILAGGFHPRHGHGDVHRARGAAWRDYDAWWKGEGQKAFQEFADRGGKAQNS